jgi:hypothetical protein
MTTSRMTNSRWTKRCKRTAWGGALGLLVLATCAAGSARAQDDNENSIWNLDQRLWSGFMGSLGLRSNNDGSVEYRERSPLVVPPQRNLPPPEAAAAKNPAWPVDADVKRREDAAAKRKAARSKGFDIDKMGANLNPSELGPTGSVASSSGSGRPDAVSTEGTNLLPSQLGYFGGLFSWTGSSFGLGPKEEVGTFKAEPPRQALTAPPVGYQTPSPAQPYGMTKRIEVAKPEKHEDFGSRQ